MKLIKAYKEDDNSWEHDMIYITLTHVVSIKPMHHRCLLVLTSGSFYIDHTTKTIIVEALV